MNAATSIPVPEDLYRDISQRAEQAGVSPQEWISSTLAERLRLEEYFDRHVPHASSRTLGELLDKAPLRSPDPGDEFEQ